MWTTTARGSCTTTRTPTGRWTRLPPSDSSHRQTFFTNRNTRSRICRSRPVFLCSFFRGLYLKYQTLNKKTSFLELSSAQNLSPKWKNLQQSGRSFRGKTKPARKTDDLHDLETKELSQNTTEPMKRLQTDNLKQETSKTEAGIPSSCLTFSSFMP